MTSETVGTPTLWGAFSAFIFVMLALDLGVFQRGDAPPKPRAAALWSLFWIGLAGVFAGLISLSLGKQHALEFVTGYVLEKALSIDNIFVFLVVFSYFKLPIGLERRVLSWGILGALFTRGIFIFSGTALVHRFHWVLYIFGVVLALTGIKLLVQKDDDEQDPGKSLPVRLFRKLVPTVDGYRGRAFTVIENGKRYATPLLLVLVTIETTDVVFALDSIPAIFGVTTDPFIVFTSNIFAILGLRSLYFAISSALNKFERLKYGLALVLIFVGAKILISGYYQVPIGLSLLVVGLLIGGSMLASTLWPTEKPHDTSESTTDEPPEASSNTR